MCSLMTDREEKNVFRLRKTMSEPNRMDITSLSSDDELPHLSTNGTCQVTRSELFHLDDDESDKDDADESHHPQQSGVANPAFVPDGSFDDFDGLPGSDTSSQIIYCDDGYLEVEGTMKSNSKGEAHEVLALPTIAVEDMSTIRQPAMEPSRSQSLSISDHDSWLDSDRGSFVVNRIQSLVQAFADRAQKIKERLVQPPTPSPSPPLDDGSEGRPRLQSLIHQEVYSYADDSWLDEQVDLRCCKMKRRYLPTFTKVLDPQSKLYISWLFFVMVAYVYNAWVITLRAVFPYQTPDNLPIFLTFDYISDLIYMMDIVLFKVRLQFLHDGFWVDDPEKTRKNYFKKTMFKMDLLSLLPLDVLYFVYGSNPLFRLPRLLKIQTFWEFFHRVDAVAKTPYVIRIIRTLLYMMYLIHLNACAYYAMSIWEGIKTNDWVFQGEGNAYIRCFYFATKTATSIGKNPKPENEYEYVFMTVSWLMGVFIFAFLIGQIRDIVATATQSKTQYRQLMDQTVMYMRNLNLPEDLQRRVRLWLNHTWEQQKTLNESGILDSLPRKMKTDVAINVHYNTLVKVQLFKDCDKALLRDLVLQLKPVLFLPGDFICRKGEVGKEMYIVNKGLVQVTGGEHGDLVLATLSEGSVFGEISLLGIPGCNRRTADVRSQGFSNLFVLSKDDLWEALKNYPEAQKVLKKKAKSLIKENEERDKANKNNNNEKVGPETIIKHGLRKPSTPRLVKTVMQVVPPDSVCAQLLTRKPSVNMTKQHPNNNQDESSHRDKPLVMTQESISSTKNIVTQKSKMPKSTILSSPSDKKKSKNYINEKKQKTKKDPTPNIPLPSIETKNFPFVVLGDSREQKESSASVENQLKSREDTKDIIKSILHLIPGEHVKSDKKRQNIVHPIQRNLGCNDINAKTANCSEDSGISVDMKINCCTNHQPSRQTMEDPDDSFSTGSNDSELSTRSRRAAQESSVNEEIDRETSENNHSGEWMSPSISVLSLRSLFRTDSSRASSIAQKDFPMSAMQTDLTDPYRPGSITSGSSSAGYDNLAFVPVDVLSSRRSSMYSDETSC